MPKARIASGENVKINERKSSLLPKAIAAGLGGAAIALACGSGISNADTNIYVGGCGDKNSQYPVDRAIQDGRYDFGANNIQINYPASMAPICDDGFGTQTGVSIADGGQKVVDAYYANSWDQVNVEGFSLGAGVVDWAAMRLAENNGGVLPGNINIVAVGDSWNPVGIQNHPLAGVITPITKGMLNIPTAAELHPVPGVTQVFDAGDPYATMNVAPLNLGEQITKFARVGQDHRIPNIGNEPYTEVQRDGVNYQIYGDDRNSGINQAIQEVGVDPGPVGTPFFDFIAPQDDPANVLNPPAPLPESGPVVPDLNIVGPAPRDVFEDVLPYPPVEPPVHLSQPSFWGEAPCFAPDGSQYWTPGDAPC
ncbi:PE-PPE domain-containing protein [Candidatus Saccharibacteria bacterium]|nr:PE-PPE domain-containing protein [Candidatus Saccharibacteria bacterium]